MHSLNWLIAAVFLPLFPLGMIFNAVFQRLRVAWVRVLLILVWPLPGLWILQNTSAEIPDGLLYWALFSALLYGFRAVVVREIGVWTGFLATSAWALSWIALAEGIVMESRVLQVLSFSLPLALVVILVAEIERRYESAYVGVVSGLAQAHPRLSGIMVLVVLAAIGSPLFPAFFTMLNTISHVITPVPAIAFGLVFVWLLWSWSGVRLLQELLVGPAVKAQHKDISKGVTVVYGSMLLALILGGLYLSGVLL
jgi:NADH:ubiquinone oxidoreductase subunit 4 (subunit M)